MPRINNKLRSCVAFARFCKGYKVEPYDLAELLRPAP
jgi:hypothetical protein